MLAVTTCLAVAMHWTVLVHCCAVTVASAVQHTPCLSFTLAETMHQKLTLDPTLLPRAPRFQAMQ